MEGDLRTYLESNPQMELRSNAPEVVEVVPVSPPEDAEVVPVSPPEDAIPDVPSDSTFPLKRTFDTMEDSNHGKELERDRDEGLLCPVCLEAWASSGPHRLCSLKCGHLFGLSCVNRWLNLRNRTCPSCNAPARKSDVREIYASKLTVLDSAETESLKIENKQLKLENRSLLKELDLQKAILLYYKEHHENTEEQKTVNAIDTNGVLSIMNQNLKCHLTTGYRLDDGECRVLSYNERLDQLFISQKNLNALWPGFGIRHLQQLDNKFQTRSPLLPTNKQEIRDMAFNPLNNDLLLIVSFDKQAKIFDVPTRKVIFTWTCTERLWSCCWDYEHSSIAYVGDEKGGIHRLDIQGEYSSLKFPMLADSIKPVAVLSLTSSRKLGRIFCCRLLSLTAYVTKEIVRATEKMRLDISVQSLLDGRFVAMSLVEDTLVISSRPTNEILNVRHTCYRFEIEEDLIVMNLLHVFQGGNHIPRLLRTSLLRTQVGLLFFAFDESVGSISGWCVGQENKILTINSQCFVRDLLAVFRNNEVLLFALSSNILKCFKLM